MRLRPLPRGAGTAIRLRILAELRKRLRANPLPLQLRFWDGTTFDLGPAPRVTLTLRTPRVMTALLTGDMARLAGAYVEGDIVVDGTLREAISLGSDLAERIGRVRLIQRLTPLLACLPRRHGRAADAEAIRRHYDISNDFYALWLDRRMIYSCAYFMTGSEDIDVAQEQKLEHICRKLRLAPGERLLDVGCGWGGLAVWAATRHSVSVVGVTISAAQAEFARRLVAREGLADRVEIRLQDYRDIEGDACFDKLVSVGMYEHVGLANLPRYFAVISRLLKPGGAVLNHGIASASSLGGVRGPPDGGFIERFVFPGGELPHISRVLAEIADAGLEIADMEDLRPHYPPTLLHWVRRLEQQRAAALATAGEQRYRIWRMYMAGMAWAFDRGLLTVDQVLAYKPAVGRQAARPWTRAYQYDSGQQSGLTGEPDWTGL